MRLSKQRIIAALVALTLFGSLYAWWKSRPDKEVARLRNLQQELFASSGKTPVLEQKQKWQEFRDEMKKLSPDQRKSVRSGMGKSMNERLRAYLKASAGERKKIIDQDIARMESMRQMWQQNKDKAGDKGPGGPNAKGRTPEQMERRNKDRLDNSAPEDRAARDLYFKELSDRRKQLGLPALGGRGGGLGRRT